MDLHFDGSKSQEGVGARCILRDLKGKSTIITCRLYFECTNNTTKYEALLQVFKKVVDLKVKNNKVFGDSQVIVRQVNNTIHCNSGHLKNYQHEIWHLKYLFDSFKISSIPQNQNMDVDLLGNVASKLLISEDFITDKFFIEFFSRPSVPDNVTNWRVFYDDEKLLQFLHSEYTFKYQVIDDEEHEKALQELALGS